MNKVHRSDGLAALWLSAYLVIALSILGYLTIDPLFRLLGAKEDTLPFIHDYMDIWFFGAVFLITPMIGNAVLRAAGDTKTPSILMACAGSAKCGFGSDFDIWLGPSASYGGCRSFVSQCDCPGCWVLA